MPDQLGGEKLGDLLVKAGLIDELQLQTALGHQRRWGHKIGKCLIDLGFIEESELLSFLSEKYKIKAVDLSKSVITEQTFSAVPEAVAKKYGAVPVFIKEGPGGKKTIILAMSDPTNLKVVDEIQFLTGYRVEPVLATESAIEKVLAHYGRTYRPESMGEERKREMIKPSDLRKQHKRGKGTEPDKDLESMEPRAEELLLGGEEVEEILDLEEAEREGIEITPDDEIKVVKDEVVMVRADKPKPKAPKIGSTTERIPVRTRIREEIPAPELLETTPIQAKAEPSFEPPKEIKPKSMPTPEPTPEELSLAPPEIELGAQSKKPEIKTPPPKPKEPIEIPESEEKEMEVVAAHEFVSWQPQEPTPLDEEPKEELEPSVLKVSPEEIKLSQPESAEEDFWEEVEEPSPKAKSAEAPPESEEEERLPFEMPIEEPEPPSPPPEKQSFLGSIEELTSSEQVEAGPEFFPKAQARELVAEKEQASGLETGEEPGEMSLEFAVKSTKEQKEEIKQIEFQIDELLNLLMKSAVGEITQEIYVRELSQLKKRIEKFRKKNK